MTVAKCKQVDSFTSIQNTEIKVNINTYKVPFYFQKSLFVSFSKLVLSTDIYLFIQQLNPVLIYSKTLLSINKI
jgi:hypothetical protein